jgi:hypothetical protein
LVADNPSREQQVREIYDLQETWTKTLESLLNQNAGGHFGKEAFAESRADARALFDALEKFVATEQRLRSQRAASQEVQYHAVFLWVPLLAAAVMIILSYWGWMSQRRQETRRKRRAPRRRRRVGLKTISWEPYPTN